MGIQSHMRVHVSCFSISPGTFMQTHKAYLYCFFFIERERGCRSIEYYLLCNGCILNSLWTSEDLMTREVTSKYCKQSHPTSAALKRHGVLTPGFVDMAKLMAQWSDRMAVEQTKGQSNHLSWVSKHSECCITTHESVSIVIGVVYQPHAEHYLSWSLFCGQVVTHAARLDFTDLIANVEHSSLIICTVGSSQENTNICNGCIRLSTLN